MEHWEAGCVRGRWSGAEVAHAVWTRVRGLAWEDECALGKMELRLTAGQD